MSVWIPPALVAAFPPIVLARWLEGSGAKWRPLPPGRAADGFGKLSVPHAGLDVGDAIVDVDLENSIHPRSGDDDAVVESDASAGQSGA